MAYIKEYWTDKEKRAEQAREHTKKMTEKYKKDIEIAIRRTSIYKTNFQCIKNVEDKDMKVVVEELDTVSAASKYYIDDGSTMALLNFSSYKNPGGMFINGSKAQEECLCHESFLYNVLKEFQELFYDWNNQHKNKALYLNRGLYSENIIFEHKAKAFCSDVITCACPNKSAAQKYQNISDEENAEVLKSRIQFVLDIAKENNVDTLILGAYGCGVFGQDAREVASIFKEYLTTTHKCFERVIFAIPKGRDGNLEAFKKVFS